MGILASVYSIRSIFSAHGRRS